MRDSPQGREGPARLTVAMSTERTQAATADRGAVLGSVSFRLRLFPHMASAKPSEGVGRSPVEMGAGS